MVFCFSFVPCSTEWSSQYTQAYNSLSATPSACSCLSSSADVNECLSSPCPPLAMCNNTQGSFTCRCPVGYQLEKGICNLGKRVTSVLERIDCFSSKSKPVFPPRYKIQEYGRKGSTGPIILTLGAAMLFLKIC